MFADETNHRDVNHTFADMESDDPNPFISKHKKDAVKAWRLENEHTFSSVGVKSYNNTVEGEGKAKEKMFNPMGAGEGSIDV